MWYSFLLYIFAQESEPQCRPLPVLPEDTPSSANMHISASRFSEIAGAMLRNSPGLGVRTECSRFRALFGVTPNVCAHTWYLLRNDRPPSSRPVHILWALLFLKVYGSEETHRTIAQVDVKTFRKWSWCFVKLIADLKVIKWDSRFAGSSNNSCRVSVDGTDFRIYEPTPFSPKWFSHKFKGPGLRYEVAVCILTGHIVWTHGPFPCGSYPDLTIYRLAMKSLLVVGEKVIADEGYKDPTCLLGSDVEGEYRQTLTTIRARQETVNRRFKQFFVLGHRFRHEITLHSVCFHAVANLTQLMIEQGSPLFQIEYSE